MDRRKQLMDRRTFLQASLVSSACLVLPGAVDIAAAVEEQSSSLAPLPRELQQKLAHDPLRPQFHLLPRHNWMNDPCAPRFHRGKYHMFFQYNPGGAVWGDMHWNHATSADLVHWKHEAIALSPGPSAFDSYGIFTGSVVPGMDVPTVLYTGVSKSSHEDETIRGEGTREVQCLATAIDDDLLTWKKLDQPVIAAPPPGLKVTGFRDPCPWKEGDTWYLGVGSGMDRVGGAVLLYTSKNGRDWTYLHPLAQGRWNGGNQINPVDTGEMWECPDFFALEGKYVLLYSTERKVYWNVGVFDKRELRFHMETSGLLDHGAYYAMKSMLDEKGRRILWGWNPEKRSEAAMLEAGWSGSMALPRVLSIDKENRLRMEVAPEFASLRREVQSFPNKTGDHAAVAKWIEAQSIRDRAGYMRLRVKHGQGSWGLRLTLKGKTIASLAYAAHDGKPALSAGGETLVFHPDPGGMSTIELWMDGSIIEIFVDDREVITIREYTASADEVRLQWTGDPAAVVEMSVAGVEPISPDRLTT